MKDKKDKKSKRDDTYALETVKEAIAHYNKERMLTNHEFLRVLTYITAKVMYIPEFAREDGKSEEEVVAMCLANTGFLYRRDEEFVQMIHDILRDLDTELKGAYRDPETVRGSCEVYIAWVEGKVTLID